MSVTQKLPSGTWRRYSADDGGYYFHNEETDQSVWDPPPGWAEPEQGAPASPSSAAGETSVSRSGASVTGRPTRPSDTRTSTLAGTDMNPGEVAAMRAQAGSTTGTTSPSSKIEEPKPRQKDIMRSSSESSSQRRGCGNCCANCTTGSCLIYFLIIFAIITIIVLAVVLTLPQTVSCDPDDEGYFVKEVDSPVLLSVSEYSFCTSLGAMNLTIMGSNFLKYNDDKPTIKLGDWSIPATYMHDCDDVSVRKQDVEECTELIVTVPVDDGTHGGGAVVFQVVNKQPSSPHPAAKVSSSSCNTVDDPTQMLVVPSPTVSTFSPSAICAVTTNSFTLNGDFFLELQVDNTSDWIKPAILYNDGTSTGSISQEQITLSGCDAFDVGPNGVAGYYAGQLCTMLTATVQAGTLNGLTAIQVVNPGLNQCAQRGNTTFYAAPPVTVTAANPPSVCWTTTQGARIVNLTGTFVAEVGSSGVIPPTVKIDGQPANLVTTMDCTDISTNSGHSFKKCSTLQVQFNIQNGPVGSQTSYYPVFTISNLNLTGCDGTFQPLAYVVPPTVSAYPTALPVICQTGNLPPYVNVRLGGTFIYGDSSLAFQFGGGTAALPVVIANLFDCYNPNGQATSAVTLCRGVDLTIANTSVTGTDKASVSNQCQTTPVLTSFDIVRVPGQSLLNPTSGTIGTFPCAVPMNFTVNAGGGTSFYRVGGVYNSFTIAGQQTIGGQDISDPTNTCVDSGNGYFTCSSLNVRVNSRVGWANGSPSFIVNTGTCSSSGNTATFSLPCN